MNTESTPCEKLSHCLKAILGVFLLLFAPVLFGGAPLNQPPRPSLASPAAWQPARVPFSFRYGGKPSAQLLPSWSRTEETAADPNSRLDRYIYTDPATGLQVTAEVRSYPDAPGAADWVLLLRNTGRKDTPILEDILPLDQTIAAAARESILRRDRGSMGRADDFEPVEEQLGPGSAIHLQSGGGRPSYRYSLPMFNLQTGSGTLNSGMIGAIGWTGNWKADFAYAPDSRSVAMRAGMQRTHLLLHPGEEIRTPRIVLMPWSGGDWNDAQNRWRRLVLAHYTPQKDGKPSQGPVLYGTWGSEPITDKLNMIAWLHSHDIPINVYGVDAGWYGPVGASQGDITSAWSIHRGDWFPNPLYYPQGLRPLGEALKADNLGFSIWLEPEDSWPGTRIAREHPDWFLHGATSKENLLNLGNPEARKGITALISGFITDYEVTWYRQDVNVQLDDYWGPADAPDRIGMTEIGHITGLYTMLDDLLRTHPGLRLDNCSSGGLRLDLEMMSRSFSVWRSDYGSTEPQVTEAQTQALSPWVPETMGFSSYASREPWTAPGPYSTPESLYLMRAGYEVGYGINPGAAGVENPEWVDWIKQALAEYREVQPYFNADYYAFTPYTLKQNSWTAWEWNRPESKDGLVLVLRRPDADAAPPLLTLHGLQPDAAYDVAYDVEIRTTYEKVETVQMKGRNLAQLQVAIPEAPGSRLIFYRQH